MIANLGLLTDQRRFSGVLLVAYLASRVGALGWDKASGKPYWRSIDIGLHVGYRKGIRGGRWVMRRYLGIETIGTADDNQDADGREILSFHQAQSKVRELARQYRAQAPGTEMLTVRGAVEAYLQGQRGRDQHLRLARHVLGDEAKKISADEIASRTLASLTDAALSAWRDRWQGRVQ